MVLFPRYHGLVWWKPAFCTHRVWRYSSFYQEVQRYLCDYQDGGFPWTRRLHQILFQVRENCYRTLWSVEDSFWGTSYGSFPNISVVFPVCTQRLFLISKTENEAYGRRFQTVKETEAESQAVLNTLREYDFQECFKNWQRCWDRCQASEGDYSEGDAGP